MAFGSLGTGGPEEVSGMQKKWPGWKSFESFESSAVGVQENG